MPPQNSPNRLNGDNYPESQTSPRLSSSTRLPIIRSSGGDDSSSRNWRTLAQRTASQELESSIDNLDMSDPNVQRDVLRRHMEMRRMERAIQSSISTYRGWAPGTIELDRPQRGPSTRIPPRNEHPSRNTATRRYRREQEMLQAVRAQNSQSTADFEDSSSMDWQPARIGDNRESVSGIPDSTSLRTAVLLESSRRQARFDFLRERINSATNFQRPEEYSQSMNLLDEFIAQPHDPESSVPNPQSLSAEEREAAEESKITTEVFQEAIILLNGLKLCHTQSDRLALLKDAGFAAVNCAEMMACEKTLDTSTVSKPYTSSWLRPGASFLGQQQTSIVSGTIRSSRGSRRRQQDRNSVQPVPPIQTDTARSWNHGVVSAASPEAAKDCWPVKVTITSVDYNNMTLTGTMEAFNVPNCKGTSLAPRDPNVSSITTYLEGEIIDFHKHFLRTTNFDASSSVDATYWRKLEPFKTLSCTEIVDGFMDMGWLSENIAQHWLVMRWKEKCFVSPSDSNSGLTISGFYYITLRRSDGKVEGLYHDPLSCPYQHLSLMPEKPVFPVYAFR